MAQNSTNIDKLRSSGHSCFVVGSDADYQYTEIIYGGGDLWKVPTQAKKNGSPSLQPLSVIFNENPDASFNIQKLNVGVNHAGVVGSVAETKVASFINVDNAHYGILSGGGGNPVSFRVLTNVWNNSPEDTALGKILKEGSVPVTRIQHSGQVAPFAMGWVASNGTLYKSLNVAKIDHTATGKYYISFQKVASSPKYIVLVTPYYNESQGIYAAPQSPQASYFSVFCTGSKTPQNFVDNSFFFVVWDF
jgi:hypothetical protein